jgi:hypothetical protein
MYTNPAEAIWSDSEPWLESAALLGVGMRLSPSKTDMWAAHFHLLVISRAQFATQLAYDRFLTACNGSSLPEIACGYLELHSFLVSAHLFWRTLQKLANDFVLPDLRQSLQQHATLIEQTKRARDHIEHMTERIEKGRGQKFGSPMDARTFRHAMGKYERGSVTFGNETFDLQAIHAAIHTIGKTVAPKLRVAIESGFTIKFGPT